MLEAVLFDIDDTLVSTTAFARQARANAVDAMVAAGLSIESEAVLHELNEVIEEFSSNYDHHYDKLLLRLPPGTLDHENETLIVAAGVVAYHDTKFRELRPFPDVVPLFRDLREAGMRLGIVTHGWRMKQAEKLIRLGLVEYLEPDSIFISDEIGIAKPNPKLYQAALRGMGLAPEEALYVGDNLSHDIRPPQTLGMKAAWVRRATRHPEGLPGIEPDHTVDDFEALRGVLRDCYGIALPS